MLSGKSCFWEKSRAKAHPDGRHFYKVLYEHNLKIKNKPDPEKMRMYTMNLSASLPNLVRLSRQLVKRVPVPVQFILSGLIIVEHCCEK
jgi:hypothetical protein